jgi:hypothetical protein
MKCSRGVAFLPVVIVSLVIGLLVLVVAGNVLFGFKGPQIIDKQLLEKSKAVCRESRIIPDGPVYDNDYGNNVGDGYPDSCDICLGGDDSIDTDRDGIPDACDNENKKPAKGITLESICKLVSGEWKEAIRQCTLQCYGDMQNPCQRQQKQSSA